MGYLHPSSIFSRRKEKKTWNEGDEVNGKKRKLSIDNRHPDHILLYILILVDFRHVSNSMILSPRFIPLVPFSRATYNNTPLNSITLIWRIQKFL